MSKEKIKSLIGEVEQSKKKIRVIKSMYNDALKNNKDYQGINDEIKELKIQKKKIEDKVKIEFENEIGKMEDLRIDINFKENILSDLVVNMITKGEDPSIKDEMENNIIPIIKVKYKKV